MKQLTTNILIFFSLIQFGYSSNQNVKYFELGGDWKFRNAKEKDWLPAKVPGCVHTDLLDNNMIPDPFYAKNELKVKWVEEKDWEYETSFEVSDELSSYENIDLQFEGLDTYADVYLNDILLFSADNMFIDWNISVKGLLKRGHNTLRIYFHSAVNIGMEKLRKVPYTLMAANEIAPENERTNVFTRKASFHYGWDWGPRLVTCGIWKPINILAWNKVKMNDLYIKPIKIGKEQASYNAIVEFVAVKDSKVNLEVWIDNKLVSKSDTIVKKGQTQFGTRFNILKPELWWTNGLGGHKLYEVEIRMKLDREIVQSISKRIGVRTIELIQEKDSIGTSFGFKLNGIAVFMKGSNYIPSDIFTTRNTLRNYKRVVNDAVNANMNMLRIWGGAIYESNEFYDLLDENGILAWNDFMFACNIQPDDSMHLKNIQKEAEYNVKRLRNHPSIALWCGNNENLRAWHDWGWKDKYSKEQAKILWNVYEKIFYKLLPEAIKKYNPEVSYWPSSPQAAGNKISDKNSGDEHDWSIWFGNAPFSNYSVQVSRFVSEYGLQSYPEMKTIRAFAGDSDLSYRSPVMEQRQRSTMPWIGKDVNGNELIKIYIEKYYKTPESFNSFIYLSQLMQAEGVKYAIEAHRRNRPNCMGSLYWQLNDCWPTMSWSSVDYYGRWKALHYMVKKAYQAVYPIIVKNNENIQVIVTNDLLEAKEVTIVSSLLNFDGKCLLKTKIDTVLKANSNQVYLNFPEKSLILKGDASQTVLEVEIISKDTHLSNNLYYFRDCKELKLEKPIINKTIRKIKDNEFEIILTTDKLVKNVSFYTTKTDGFFSDNYFDLIPGKTYTITFKGKILDLSDELQMVCLNELYL